MFTRWQRIAFLVGFVTGACILVVGIATGEVREIFFGAFMTVGTAMLAYTAWK